MPGMCTSVIIKSGVSEFNSSIRSDAFENVEVAYPEFLRLSSRTILIASSSSASQTLCTFSPYIFESERN